MIEFFDKYFMSMYSNQNMPEPNQIFDDMYKILNEYDNNKYKNKYIYDI